MGNLERACRRLCIDCLSQMSLDQAQLEEFACTEELKAKQDQAPKLRSEHLQNQLDKAKARKDEDAVKAITRILKREFDKKSYGRMHAAFGKTRTLPAAQIAEPCPTGPDPLFSNQDQVEDAATRHLTERFTQAHSAPINSGQLLEDVGILADTTSTDQILRDEYEYLTDVDPATKTLLQEAAKIFKATAEEGVTTFVTSKD